LYSAIKSVETEALVASGYANQFMLLDCGNVDLNCSKTAAQWRN